jgi:hypothetical protein
MADVFLELETETSSMRCGVYECRMEKSGTHNIRRVWHHMIAFLISGYVCALNSILETRSSTGRHKHEIQH